MAVKFQDNLAIMPRDEYEAMKALADEAWEDRQTARLVDRAMADIAAGMPVFPLEIADRLTNGENPIRVLREFRGMTQAELATSEGLQITQNYLSELETGKRKGPLALHQKLARVLGVPLDLLAGDDVSDEKADPVRTANRKKAITETKRRRKR